MKAVYGIVALVLVMAVVLWRVASPHSEVKPPLRKSVPVAAIENGKTQPRVGLVKPLPGWVPLPDKGMVIGAGVYPAQRPYGASAVVMLQLDGSEEAFTASYRNRLARAGFSMRQLPEPFNLIVDRPDALFEADERNGGHTVYITLRAKHFAQLTFWDPPAPRK